jgi:hypothetical protein
VTDFHLGIVHDVDEMKDPGAVGSANRHIRIRFRARHVEFDPAADDVVDHYFLAREAEANRALIFIDAVGGLQFVEITLIDLLALALKIGTVNAASRGPSFQSSPSQCNPS